MPGERTRDIKLLNEDLVHAIKTGATVAFEKALERGASVEATDPVYTHTALMVAVERQNLAMIHRLFEAGANVNAMSGEFPQSPLHIAAQKDSTEITELLIEHGADINAKGWRCMTPLHAACKAGKLAQVNLLLDRGAKPTGTEDNNFDPPLMVAFRSGNLDIAACLLSRFPDLFKNCDGRGMCPLREFAYWKAHELVAWLLNQPMPEWLKLDSPYFRNAAAAAVEELWDYEQWEGYEAARSATIEVFRRHGDL